LTKGNGWGAPPKSLWLSMRLIGWVRAHNELRSGYYSTCRSPGTLCTNAGDTDRFRRCGAALFGSKRRNASGHAEALAGHLASRLKPEKPRSRPNRSCRHAEFRLLCRLAQRPAGERVGHEAIIEFRAADNGRRQHIVANTVAFAFERSARVNISIPARAAPNKSVVLWTAVRPPKLKLTGVFSHPAKRRNLYRQQLYTRVVRGPSRRQPDRRAIQLGFAMSGHPPENGKLCGHERGRANSVTFDPSAQG
jgi:hypothetical protein